MALPTEDLLTETARRSCRSVLLFLVAFSIHTGVSIAQQKKAQPPQGLAVLETIREVRELPSEKARLRHPIHVRGVVTYADKTQNDLFIQDSTAGIYVDYSQLAQQLHSGQYVEITGVSGTGDFASQIENPKI